MKAIPRELNLTPEEAAGVAKYRELVQQHRHEGHLRRYYAELDDQFPNLNQKTRDELAEAKYRKALADGALRRNPERKG